MSKLTDAQKVALLAMPFRVTMWGGRVHGGWPTKGFTQRSLDGLTHRGLARFRKVGNFEYEYRMTDAGRDALGNN